VPTIAMAFPIPPDKVETWLRGMAEISGPRRAEFDAARRRQGVTGSKVWLQEGPGGPVEILVMETEDPAKAFADIGASQEPFDVWFRALIRASIGQVGVRALSGLISAAPVRSLAPIRSSLRAQLGLAGPRHC
jgi:hypothetical protein